MAWNPALGTTSLATRIGHQQALDALIGLLAGGVSGSDLVWSSTAAVLLDIGDGHAERLMDDATGRRLAYWPRVWAARSMAYLGDLAAVPTLVRAIEDEHWRVRMTSIQTLGRLGAEGVTYALLAGLADEHERVREAAVVALGRVGTDEALVPLLQTRIGDGYRDRLQTAIDNITRRT